MATDHTRIAESSIPGAGRGCFLTKDVVVGELVFDIKKPLLAIVDWKVIENTCDECFAYSGPSGRNFYGKGPGKEGEKDKEYLICDLCEIARYCSRVCCVSL